MSHRVRLAALVVGVLGLYACSPTGTEPAGSGQVAQVTVTASSAAVGVGETLQLVATVTDAAGAVVTNPAIVWTSSDTTRAKVTATGLVNGVAPGTVTVGATAGGVSGTLSLVVVAAGISSVVVTPSTVSLAAGSTVQLSAVVKSNSGAVVPGATVTWVSSDTSKAAVSAAGLVTGLGSAVAPQIASVAPATITPGVPVTVTGANFAVGSGGVSVTVAGTPVPATVTSATTLTFTLPTAFPCVATGNTTLAVANSIGTVTVTASSGGQTGAAAVIVGSTPATAQHAVQVANQLALGVGQSALITDPNQVGCTELTGGAHYLVDVYNDSRVPSGIAAFVLRGAVGPASGALAGTRAPAGIAAAPMVPMVPRMQAAPVPAGALALMAGAAAHMRDGHALQLAQRSAYVRPLLAQLKAHARRPRAGLDAAAALNPPIPQTVGDTATVKIDTVSQGDQCKTWVSVQARVVYVGSHSIILEDVNAPLARTMDADYVALGQHYDSLQYPIITQYFGDPMAFDDSLTRVGKVTMLFSPLANAAGGGGELGWVTPCDLFPTSFDADVPSSNHTEMFYAVVPTLATGSTNDAHVRSVWDALMPATLIHETKHIAATAERFADPVGTLLEESWLEEGTAQIAVELYGRAIYGTAWKGDVGYNQSVYYDVRNVTPYIMTSPFLDLYDYMQHNETKSFLSAGTADPDIYGSAWLFSRWMLDQYSTQESDILKPLIADATLAGIANVTDKTGRLWDELDGYFTMAYAADQYPGSTAPANARYIVPSWNLRDIFQGLSYDFPYNFASWPLAAHATAFGTFSTEVDSLAGGSGSIFDISGSLTGRQLLDLHAVSGAVLPLGHTLRMVVVRVE